MTWWVRSQRPIWVVVVLVAGTISVALLPSTAALPIPSLSGTTAFAPVRPFALIAVLMTITVWTSVSAGHKSAILASVRAVSAYVYLAVCAGVLLCVVVTLAVSLLAGAVGSASFLLLRNVLGLFGFGLAAAPFIGHRYVGAAATAYLFVAAVFGRTHGDSHLDSVPWAWPISDSLSVTYWVPALGLFLVGTLVWFSRGRWHHSRIMIAQAMDSRRE